MSDIQSQTDVFFVRSEIAEAKPAPSSSIGPVAWVRRNLFPTPVDTLLTILGVAFIAIVLPPLVRWALVNSVWTGADREACLGESVGACWAFVNANFGQFMFGRYPIDERWRVLVVYALLVVGLVPMAIPSVPYKAFNVFFLFVPLPIISYFLLVGGVLGLPLIETPFWGGLMLTVVVSYVGMALSLPFGILLALGRRSELPGIRALCIAFIEIWRGVPLITVLFMASVMLPLFLPPGVNFDKLLRALIGVAMFASAYMAEVIRAGLQAVPRGQYEGARSLGVGYWAMMRLVVLPQALKIVIPGIVNTFIGLFKDTSLVYIIGLFDLLGIVRLNFANPDWSTPETPSSGLVFAAFVYWIFCFGMSRYSQSVERRLNTGYK